MEFTSLLLWQTLEKNTSEELQVQLKIFYEHRDEDFDEFAQRYERGVVGI